MIISGKKPLDFFYILLFSGYLLLVYYNFCQLLTDIPTTTVFEKNGLKLDFSFERNDEQLTITLKAFNSSSQPMENFVFQAAVPKVSRLFHISACIVKNLF